MTALLAAMTAVQVFIAAPLDAVGTTRAELVRHLGEPLSTAVDYVASPRVAGATDRVVTLEYPHTQARLYETSSPETSYLLYLATVDERFVTRTGVHVGVDRGTVLRELGGPAYEDDGQVIYAQPRPDDSGAGERVRLVIEDDRVVGIEWSFGVR